MAILPSRLGDTRQITDEDLSSVRNSLRCMPGAIVVALVVLHHGRPNKPLGSRNQIDQGRSTCIRLRASLDGANRRVSTMSGSLSPWPVIAAGSNGHPVKSFQYLLRARSHTVAVDGIFGPQTDAAVKAFQAIKGLAANGTVGPETWTALILQVKKGSTGDAV